MAGAESGDSLPPVARVQAVLEERSDEWIEISRLLPAIVSQFGVTNTEAARPMIEQLIKEHNARVGPPPPVPKEKWESDDEVSNCRSCSKSFGFLTRRHHCRQCGKVYCSDCCNSTAYVLGCTEPARVCKPCAVVLDSAAQLPSAKRRESEKSTKSRWFPSFGSADAKDSQKAAAAAEDKHASIRVKRDSNEAAASGSALSVAPEDEGDRFTYACMLATFFSDAYFRVDTDPEGVWRTAQVEAIVSAMQMEEKKPIVMACMEGESVDPLPLIDHFRKENGGARVIEAYLKVTAMGGAYDARARILLLKLSSLVLISRKQLADIESSLAQTMIQIAEEASEEVKKEIEAQRRKNTLSRRLKIGFGTVAGGVLIGVTAGLAAPLVAVGATAAFGASAGAALAGTAGVATLGTLFGAGGAGLLAQKTNKRYGQLREFEFVKLYGEDHSSLSVVVNVPGWVNTNPATPLLGSQEPYVANDFVVPVTSADNAGEGYTLVWESQKLYELSSALSNFASNTLVEQSASLAVKHTVLASVTVALAVPAALIKASDLIDNPWGVCVEAANAAGVELANVLLERVQGSRPVTLVGYSMGALVIASALREMTQRGESHGIVQDVYLFGTPASGQSTYWDSAAMVVAGKIVNFRSTNDWFLKLMLRGLSVEKCVAGLEGINHPRAVNVDVSAMIELHSDWALKMPKLLQLAGLSTRYSNRPFFGNIGDRVRVHGKGEGILRFHGWLHELEPLLHTHPDVQAGADSDKRPEWFGVAMDEPVGKRDGSLKHGKYFECEDGHALFIPANSDAIELVEGRYSHPNACYSASCRKRRGSQDGGPIELCRCFSPVCRTDLGGLARLSERPNDDSMVRDEASASKSWGLGRLLRTQRDASEAAKAGGDAERVLVTAESLGSTRVRFTKCESPLVDAAVYTIAISSVPTESCMDSGADWIITRTFAELQGIHAILQSEMGQKYSKTPFPDSLFTTAQARMPLLQAWLQDAVALVPYCGESAEQKIVCLLGARLATQASPERAKPGDGAAESAPARRGERLRIPVGASRSNTKRVQLPATGLIVNPQPVNPQDPKWTDTFVVDVTGTILEVRRIDSAGGWTQELELVALAPDDPDREDSESFTIQHVDAPF